MKRVFTLTLGLALTSCYNRIGDFNMVSNRNIDSDRQYELYQKNVEAKGKSRNNDAMEKAVDNATKDTDGEYMMNVAIYVKRKGRKVKVIGDVYGVAKSDTITGH